MPPNVLCSVCRVEEHEELIEPVITSCGHLFCWPCLYTWVKTKTAAGDYPCPMCRLLVSAVTSDLSRGKYRDEEQVLQSRIPRRPGQGIFPFDFDLAATGQDMNNDADVQPETSGVQQQQLVGSDQPPRRSQRNRRRNLRLRGFIGDYIEDSSEDDENMREGPAISSEATNVVTRNANEDIERIDSESDMEEVSDVETNSDIELPEVETRFIRRVGDNEGSFTEQDMAGPVNISMESVIPVEQQSLEGVNSEDNTEEPLSDESTDADHMRLQAGGDIVANALPEDDHREDAIEERRYFSSKTVIEGTQLTHLEATVLYTFEEIQEKNVKIASLNCCTVARALKRDHDSCFPGKSIKDISKLIKNIMRKAKRDFENQKPVLPLSLRAGDQRQTRMEETMRAILRIDSAAPEAVRQTARRGVPTRRPPIDGRPTIPGPDVGRIAEQVTADGQDNYLEQRRRNQEQGAELREASLGRMQNTRVNNNMRLSTQLNNFSSALATLSQTRQQSSSAVGNLMPELVTRREERARSRSRERAERRTMDLLLVASVAKNEELASSVNVGRNLTVFKKTDPDLNISPDFPITLKLTNIEKLTKDLSDYLEAQSEIHGIVLKPVNSFKRIITSCDIIECCEVYAELYVKRDKTYVLITEKPRSE